VVDQTIQPTRASLWLRPPGPVQGLVSGPSQPVPVWAWGAATGLDSGEPRWRR
jgi:hypothetical protein